MEDCMKTVAVVQARLGSTRLPNKVMREVVGTPLIALLLRRLSGAMRVDEIVVATTDRPADDALAQYLESQAVRVWRGSEKDVLDRYYWAAKVSGADLVVRITGDCPLVDPKLVDRIVGVLHESASDYVSNTNPPTFPDGLDVEACTFAVLERAWKESSSAPEREHVTPFMKCAADIRRVNVTNSVDLSAGRWTVDEPEDLDLVRRIFEHFAPRVDFGWQEVLELETSKPELFQVN